MSFGWDFGWREHTAADLNIAALYRGNMDM
jgi:hypothetical protein